MNYKYTSLMLPTCCSPRSSEFDQRTPIRRKGSKVPTGIVLASLSSCSVEGRPEIWISLERRKSVFSYTALTDKERWWITEFAR